MITAMLWIGVEANEIVGLLTALGIFWKIPTAIMGLTFLAWANSIGDLVADISLAKLGKAKTAVAACFGSPLLNLLFGTGIGCLAGILGAQSGDQIPLDVSVHKLTNVKNSQLFYLARTIGTIAIIQYHYCAHLTAFHFANNEISSWKNFGRLSYFVLCRQSCSMYLFWSNKK